MCKTYVVMFRFLKIAFDWIYQLQFNLVTLRMDIIHVHTSIFLYPKNTYQSEV
jgi:hypothetical protein